MGHSEVDDVVIKSPPVGLHGRPGRELRSIGGTTMESVHGLNYIHSMYIPGTLAALVARVVGAGRL